MAESTVPDQTVDESTVNPIPFDPSHDQAQTEPAVKFGVENNPTAENWSPPAPPEAIEPRPAPPSPENNDLAKQAKTFITGQTGILDKLKPILFIFLGLLVVVLVGLALYRFGPSLINGKLKLPFTLPFLTTNKEVSLTYWGLWEEEGVMNGLIAEYQQNHPNVKINYQKQTFKEYRERLQSALTREDRPDIFTYHNTWVPMLKTDLSPIPATVMDAATFESSYYPVVRNDLHLGATYVGLPLGIDGLALFINDDIFKAANKQPPKTWDELRKTALELTVKDSQGQIQVAGAALGRTENVDHWSDILALMMLQNGADLNKPTGKLAEDALTYFTIFSQVDKVWDATMPPSTLAFAGKKLAMYFGPSWEVFAIKKANPDLAFQVVPVPQLPDTNITWASYWVEGVAKKSPKQEEAWDFLKFLTSREEMQKLYQGASKTRLFGQPYARVEMASLLQDQPYVGAYIKEAPTVRSGYLSSRTYDNGLNDKIIKYFENAVNAVNQGNEIGSALETASQGVAQVLAQYGLSSAVNR